VGDVVLDRIARRTGLASLSGCITPWPPAWRLSSMERLLDTKADMLADPPTPWTPVPMPTDSDLLRDKRGQQRLQYHDALTAIRHPLAPIRYRLAAWPALRELIADRRYRWSPASTVSWGLTATWRSSAAACSRLRMLRRLTRDGERCTPRRQRRWAAQMELCHPRR
jgi:hypothetical protein